MQRKEVNKILIILGIPLWIIAIMIIILCIIINNLWFI